ncbi:PA14 domain-containing protein [Tropicibacter sp. S64]|uniref:PA14 domain-containing protein n=1 Tax=Tropicibacter sp. S64 TaxID=3415122 RepID=UPI003C7E0AFF
MPDVVSQYLFGNSLIAFSGGGIRTSLPFWMDYLADSEGNTYEGSGGYGFLRNFADNPNPPAAWGFGGLNQSINPGETFATADINTVLITPANFIQDVSPDTDYVGDVRSPLDAVIDIVGTVNASHPTAQILIYEGMADLAPFTSTIPPSDAALDSYYDYILGPYHDWYVDLVDQVNDAFPEDEVQLVPVGSILADLLSTTLSDIPATDLYVDDAPHGTETLFYLTAMVTYQATFGEPAPLPDVLPDSIHPSVFTNYDEINAVIEAGLIEADVLDDLPDTTPDPVIPDPVVPDPVIPDPVEPDPDTTPDPQPDPTPTPDPATGDDTDDAGAPVAPTPVDPTDPVVDSGDRPAPGPVPPVDETPVPDETPVGSDADEPDNAPSVPDAPVGTYAVDFFTLGAGVTSLDQVDFTATPDATGTEDALDFVGEAGSFWDGGPTDNVAAAYSQTLESPDGGVYHFSLMADDQAQVYVDGTLVLDTADVGFEEVQDTTVDLSPGNHLLEVHYLEQDGEASLQLGVNRIGDLPDQPSQPDPAPAQQTLADQVSDMDDITSIFTVLQDSWNAMEAEAEYNGRVEEELDAEPEPVV